MSDSLASKAQTGLFFALCADMGIKSEEAKERAKAKFNLDSFTSITKTQLSLLIDALNTKAAQKPVHVHTFEVEAHTAERVYSHCTGCPALLIETRPEHDN